MAARFAITLRSSHIATSSGLSWVIVHFQILANCAQGSAAAQSPAAAQAAQSPAAPESLAAAAQNPTAVTRASTLLAKTTSACSRGTLRCKKA